MAAGWVGSRTCALAGSASSSLHRLQRRCGSASATNVEGARLHGGGGRLGPQAQADYLDLDSPQKVPVSMDEEDDRDPKPKLTNILILQTKLNQITVQNNNFVTCTCLC